MLRAALVSSSGGLGRRRWDAGRRSCGRLPDSLRHLPGQFMIAVWEAIAARDAAHSSRDSDHEQFRLRPKCSYRGSLISTIFDLEQPCIAGKDPVVGHVVHGVAQRAADLDVTAGFNGFQAAHESRSVSTAQTRWSVASISIEPCGTIGFAHWDHRIADKYCGTTKTIISQRGMVTSLLADLGPHALRCRPALDSTTGQSGRP
jgi:hypothetical protein